MNVKLVVVVVVVVVVVGKVIIPRAVKARLLSPEQLRQGYYPPSS